MKLSQIVQNFKTDKMIINLKKLRHIDVIDFLNGTILYTFLLLLSLKLCSSSENKNLFNCTLFVSFSHIWWRHCKKIYKM